MKPNKNLAAFTSAALHHGAVAVEWESGQRHDKVKVTLPGGVTGRCTISHGPVDPYKLKGWARQLVNRTKARHANAAA